VWDFQIRLKSVASEEIGQPSDWSQQLRAGDYIACENLQFVRGESINQSVLLADNLPGRKGLLVNCASALCISRAE
jgi:hypothetical protein